VVPCFIGAIFRHSQVPGPQSLEKRVDFGSRGRLHDTAFRPSARVANPTPRQKEPPPPKYMPKPNCLTFPAMTLGGALFY
jgi:hypothetical protein